MPEKQHSFTTTEIWAGGLVLAAAAAMVAFMAVVYGYQPETNQHTYYADFTNVLGLIRGAEVRYGGLLCGKVAAIEPNPEDQTLIRVAVAVDPDVPVNEDTIATIKQLSLTADWHLELSTGKPDSIVLASGETVQAVTTSGGLIELPELTGVVARTETLLDDVIAFLGVDEAEELEASGEEEFAKLSRLTAQLRATVDTGNALLGDVRRFVEEEQPQLSEIVDNAAELSAGANRLVTELDDFLTGNRPALEETIASTGRILADVESVTGAVQNDIDSLLAALESLLGNADGLTGDARAFLDDNRAEIEALIRDLGDASAYLEDFTRTIARQPQAIVRGATPQGR